MIWWREDESPIVPKNQVLSLVLDAGFAPTDFKWAVEGTTRLFYVGHGASPRDYFYFHFEVSPRGQRYSSFSPGKENLVQQHRSAFWDEAVEAVQLWLSCLRRELEAPDLWSLLGRTLPASGETPSDRRLLTPIERQRIGEAAKSVRAVIDARTDLSASERAAMHDAVTPIEAPREHVTVRDWKLLVYGAVASTLVEQTLTPDLAKWLLAKIWAAVAITLVAGEKVMGALMP